MNNKVLIFYINTIHDGGAERVILQLAHHFAEAGYRSILVTSYVDINEYPVPENVERISIEQEQIEQSRVGRNVSRILALHKLCKMYKPAALISFMAEPNFRAMIATIGLPVKNIVSVRNDPNREYKGMLGTFVGKHIISRADGCVFQTEEAKSWFPKRLQDKSRIIFNDVDPIFFNTERVGGTDIVTLGRLSDQKNQSMLIRAFASIADKYPDTNLLIYGIGPLENILIEQITELSIQSRIKLMGLTDNAADVYSRAKIFVLPSNYEGMPNALLEALAMGVPCISTDCPCGGPRTVIHDGINGLLVPVADEEKMASALKIMLDNPEYAERMGIEAKKRARIFKTKNVFSQWKNYIEGIING